ncbi:hypothetical protein [Tenacibaculum sp. MAR_2009_124]|nr:hypothetical protein [Tenacibaculum sp. MAR_2009_124]
MSALYDRNVSFKTLAIVPVPPVKKINYFGVFKRRTTLIHY